MSTVGRAYAGQKGSLLLLRSLPPPSFLRPEASREITRGSGREEHRFGGTYVILAAKLLSRELFEMIFFLAKGQNSTLYDFGGASIETRKMFSLLFSPAERKGSSKDRFPPPARTHTQTAAAAAVQSQANSRFSKSFGQRSRKGEAKRCFLHRRGQLGSRLNQRGGWGDGLAIMDILLDGSRRLVVYSREKQKTKARNFD